MLNYIWFWMLSTGFLVGAINGRLSQVTDALINSSKMAVELGIGLVGVMCLWSGLMGIAEKSGMVNWISDIFNPVLRRLFPDIPKGHPALGAITMNLAANFFGLGNAATPLGIKAVNELQKLNKDKETATDSMSMFVVLNTSAIQLIPATIIAVRAAASSQNPSEILVPIWGATICATIAGIAAVKVLSFLYTRKVR